MKVQLSHKELRLLNRLIIARVAYERAAEAAGEKLIALANSHLTSTDIELEKP